MIAKKISGALAAFATVALLGGVQAAQPMQGQLFPMHTPPKDQCPGLDWFAYVDGDNILTGTVSWDHNKNHAAFEGKVDADGNFKADAQVIGGPGKGIVSGRLLSQYLQIRIDYSATKCDGVYWTIQRAPNIVPAGGGG
jgi:hypothetical protein